MTQSEFFKRLGAPLKNTRWSWGARRAGGDLVLRVWKDRTREFNGRSFAMLTHHSKYAHNQRNPGYKERNRHVDEIRGGTCCYMVMCHVEDVAANPRQIRTFEQDNVYLGGTLLECEGDWWIEIVKPIPAAELFTPVLQQ
ncbi:hypothetical protein [Pseudomonas sp. SWI36]|uniref:hypothetical protein n=1 Tax=Pseudomonas sp. SWI36 TaxID=2083052 RepID=UPI00131A2B50|nr:hypothetical protein [Pseudomonas sp. SWI36]